MGREAILQMEKLAALRRQELEAEIARLKFELKTNRAYAKQIEKWALAIREAPLRTEGKREY